MPPPPLPQQNGKSGPPPLPTSAPQFKNKSGPPPLPISVGTPPLPATSATQKLAEGELFLGMAKSAFDEQRFDETEVNLAMDAFIEVLRLEPGNERAQEGLGRANCLLASINDAKREQEREQEEERERLESERAHRAEEREARRQTGSGVLQKLGDWFSGKEKCPKCKGRGGRTISEKFLHNKIRAYVGEQIWVNVYLVRVRCEYCHYEWTYELNTDKY